MYPRIREEEYVISICLRMLDLLPPLLAEYDPDRKHFEVHYLFRRLQETLRPLRTGQLRKRHYEFLEFLKEFEAAFGTYATVEQVAQRFNIQCSSARTTLKTMHRSGLVHLSEDGTARRIDLDFRDPIKERLERLQRDNSRLRVALLDAIRKPQGVVPVSAEPFIQYLDEIPSWFRMESDRCFRNTKSSRSPAPTAKGGDSRCRTAPASTTGIHAKSASNARPAMGKDRSTSMETNSSTDLSTDTDLSN